MYGSGDSRSPCGERGLKFRVWYRLSDRSKSLPVRGAWIEIVTAYKLGKDETRRSPCGERGLKSSFRRVARLDLVAPRAGSVD